MILPAFIAGPAMAASPTPGYNWSGFYFGGNAGAAWGRSNATTSPNCNYALNPPGYFCDTTAGAANAALVAGAGSGGIAAGGFTGGVQAGYNWQVNNLIYGLETDFGAFSLRGSRQGPGVFVVGVTVAPGDTFTAGSSFATDWLYTFRGRVGMTLSSTWMGFVTGGLALTDLKVSNSYSDNIGGSESGSASKLQAGWAIGGGLEWALAQNWSAKVEYLYVSFGKVTATGNITNPTIGPGYAQALSTSSDLTASIARVGVNHKF
jgi:outer membrane immunogenic protein